MVAKKEEKISTQTGMRMVRALERDGLTKGDAQRIIMYWRVRREVVDTVRTTPAARQYHSSLCV